MKNGEIHILLHHAIMVDPYPSAHSIFYRETIAKFQRLGFMTEDLLLTSEGHSFLARLREVEP